MYERWPIAALCDVFTSSEWPEGGATVDRVPGAGAEEFAPLIRLVSGRPDRPWRTLS